MIEKSIPFEGLDDMEVISLVQRGNMDAQTYIITKYKDLVKMKARTYFIVGADKEDLVQEGMIGLFKAIRDYRPDKKTTFYSFAELCVTRQIITAIKSATRQKHVPLNSYISLNRNIYEEDSEKSYMDCLVDEKLVNPEELLIDQEEKVKIESYINEVLSEMECRVLALYLKGKSYIEIAHLMHKDEKAIDNALQRVRRKIEKRIDKNIQKKIDARR